MIEEQNEEAHMLDWAFVRLYRGAVARGVLV